MSESTKCADGVPRGMGQSASRNSHENRSYSRKTEGGVTLHSSFSVNRTILGAIRSVDVTAQTSRWCPSDPKDCCLIQLKHS